RGERAAKRQVIGSGLLLDDAPAVLLVRKRPEQVVDQLDPVDAGFESDEAAFAIDVDHPVQAGHVDERAATAELLAAHRVTAATEAQTLSRAARGRHQLLQLADGTRAKHARDGRGVQLRVDIVDDAVMTGSRGASAAGPG